MSPSTPNPSAVATRPLDASPASASARHQVLVLGASGRLGRAVVEAFAQAGWAVVAQVRRDRGGWPAGVRAVAAELADTPALARAAEGTTAVVYAVNPVYTDWDTELLPRAREGLAVAAALGALFMLPGNVYGFGEAMPPRLTPDTPQRPTTAKGRQRVALEAEMAAWPGLRSVVLRAGDFFGAGTGSWLDLVIARDLLPGGRGRRLTYPGPLDRVHAWAYLPDLARAFVAVAQHDADRPASRVAHRVFTFAGHAVTGAEWLDALQSAASRCGVSPAGGWRHGSMPWGFIRLAGWVWPMGRELSRMAYLWRVPHALDGSALEAAVGRQPSTPLVDALTASLQALGVPARGPAPDVRPARS